MKPILPAFLLLISILTACTDSNRHTADKTQTALADPATSEAMATVYAATDTSTYPTEALPVDSGFSMKILTVGTFHSDEVWTGADKEKWFGLFQNKTDFYLAETRLKTKRVHDIVVDEKESEKTGWLVETLNQDSAILLMQGQNFFTNRRVEPAPLAKKQLYPGDTLQIMHAGVDYELFATGNAKPVGGGSDELEVRNYKLYLTATVNGQKRKSLLVAQPDFDDNMIQLLFAGDMDGDGILDWIIDTSRHYNVSSPTLYLSKPARTGEVVKPVGQHTTVGC